MQMGKEYKTPSKRMATIIHISYIIVENIAFGVFFFGAFFCISEFMAFAPFDDNFPNWNPLKICLISLVTYIVSLLILIPLMIKLEDLDKK